MASRRGRVANLALGLLLVGYQVLAHCITAADRLTVFGVAVMIVPVLAGALWALAVEFGWRLAAMVAFGLALAAGIGILIWGRPSAAFVYGLPHFSANLFLLWFFARTLRGAQTPLVTRIATRIEGRELPPAMLAYTWRVTLAWSLFFAAQLLMSLLLYSMASRVAWSFFINILGSLLIPVMFIAEFGWRRLRHREHARGPVFARADLFSRASSSAPVDPR